MSVMLVSLLAILVYNVMTMLSLKDLLSRFGFLKKTRRDFYECGFSPQSQQPPRMSLQFLLMCMFFLLYDIELVFLFPFVSAYSVAGLYDLLLLMLFFSLMVISLIMDYESHALYWQE